MRKLAIIAEEANEIKSRFLANMYFCYTAGVAKWPLEAGGWPQQSHDYIFHLRLLCQIHLVIKSFYY